MGRVQGELQCDRSSHGPPHDDDSLRPPAAGEADSGVEQIGRVDPHYAGLELRRDVEPYDVIISEPSNPWITGVANLFTRDFFELAASRLAPGGIFAQWFHLYGMSEDSAREVMATFRSVFPHVVAFNDRDMILLGSDRPIMFSLDQMTRRFADPGVRASLAEAFVRYPADLLVKLRLDERGTAAFAAGAVAPRGALSCGPALTSWWWRCCPPRCRRPRCRRPRCCSRRSSSAPVSRCRRGPPAG